MKILKKEKVELPKRLDYNPYLEELITYSKNHKGMLQHTKNVGCYYCERIFPVVDIVEWCDKGNTALCPNCGVDSILPDSEGELTPKILSLMHRYWFDNIAYAVKMSGSKVVDIIDESGLYDPVEFEVFRKNLLESRG